MREKMRERERKRKKKERERAHVRTSERSREQARAQESERERGKERGRETLSSHSTCALSISWNRAFSTCCISSIYELQQHAATYYNNTLQHTATTCLLHLVNMQTAAAHTLQHTATTNSRILQQRTCCISSTCKL